MSQEVIAKGAAGLSGTLAGWTWIAPLNELLQLGATAVAIIAGLYAIRWHKVRLDEAAEKRKRRRDKSD